VKRYDELTEAQQATVVALCLEKLALAIQSGEIRFDDDKNGDDLQRRLDWAIRKANGDHSILDVLGRDAREELYGMAQCDAEDAYYLEPGETAIRIPD
jgi:hypothetical protein